MTKRKIVPPVSKAGKRVTVAQMKADLKQVKRADVERYADEGWKQPISDAELKRIDRRARESRAANAALEAAAADATRSEAQLRAHRATLAMERAKDPPIIDHAAVDRKFREDTDRGVGASKVPADHPGIPSATGNLKNALSALESKLTMLGDKLTPFLLPSHPANTGEDSSSASRSPHSDWLNGAANHAYALGRYVDDLLSRVDH